MLPVSLRKLQAHEFPEHQLTLYLAPPTMGPQLDLDAWRIECFGPANLEGGVDEREEIALTAMLSAPERERYDALRAHQQLRAAWELRQEAIGERKGIEQMDPKPDDLSDEDQQFLNEVGGRIRRHDPHIATLYSKMQLALSQYALGEIACCLVQLKHEGEIYTIDTFDEAVAAVKLLPVDVANRAIDICRAITSVSPAERRDSLSPSTSPTPTPEVTPAA